MIKRLLNLISDTFKRFIDWITHVDYRHIFLDIANFIGDIMHRALFDLLLPKKYRTLTKQEIFTIIFKSDTPRGKKFDIWLLILIGLNVMVIMLESVSDAPKWFTLSMNIIGWLFTLLFTFEFYLRIYCLEHPRKYIVSLFAIIDIISIFPAYLSIFLPAASTLSVLRLMRVLRIFRIFRMERFIEESRFLINALRRSATKILVFMLFVFIMAVILGATMYGIEGEKNPDISSIPRGVYWAVVTITTVGYGDIAPVTATGQFISMIVMLLGYSIIAVPTGIVAGDTIEEYRNQHERKRQHRKRRNELHPEPDEDKEEADSHSSNQDPSEDSQSSSPDSPAEDENDDSPILKPRSKQWNPDPGAKANPEDLL